MRCRDTLLLRAAFDFDRIQGIVNLSHLYELPIGEESCLEDIF